MLINIYSKGVYPANVLSNFYNHEFVVEGVKCGSLEGFLQSLKYMNSKKAEQIAQLSGIEAKHAGKRKIWWKFARRVYWKGICLTIGSDELEELIDRAFFACYEQCPEYKKAIFDLEDDTITHSIGKTSIRQTILTRYHFIRRIEYLRLFSKLSGEMALKNKQ